MGLMFSCNTNSPSESHPVAVDSLRPADNEPKYIDLVTWESLSNNPKSVKFHIAGIYFYLSGVLSDDEYKLSMLQVIISATKHYQTTVFSKDEYLWSKTKQASFVKIIDVNLDGYGDLLLFSSQGGSGNLWYDAWLFDSITSNFVFSFEYSDLCYLSVTKDRKMVKSYWRSSYYEDTVWYYKPDGFHEPILLKKVFSDIDRSSPNGFRCWKVTVDNINGKWVETQRVIRNKGLFEEEYMIR